MNDVMTELREVVKDKSLMLTADTELIGNGRVLDSMTLVELCLRLEDRAASMGFEFDWTSESAMSRSRSMFRTVGALQEEYSRQHAEQA
jgi:acyl carrier protein